MKIRSKEKHKDRGRVTYKAEGDGFQYDVLCQEEYTYQVYMINDPNPEKYLCRGFYPLSSSIIIVFNIVYHKHHPC